jgi:hypothetical protein
MRKIDTYIIEKLKLNKNVKVPINDVKEGDLVLIVTLRIHIYTNETECALQCSADYFNKTSLESGFKCPLKPNTNGYLQMSEDLYPNINVRIILTKEEGIYFMDNIIKNTNNIKDLNNDKLLNYFDKKYIDMVNKIPLFDYPKKDHIENTFKKLTHA